ncbi:MAG: hypothetical protein JSW39_15940 [Desulfobacterales bacterium]|nr:MAG: hypothetical protein JSW39_15940 [Desulfobacterales bacterium]
MAPPPQLIAQVGRPSLRPVSPAVRALADALLARFGYAAQAILFYGSCWRTGDDREGLVDLYLLVDSYRSAYHQSRQAFLNKLLPPNVFYLEVSCAGRIARAKYAVLSLADFQHGTSRRWFHSYLWARFAQPAGLVYARNEQVARQVQAALAQAVMTFIARVLPRVPSPFTARELWRQGLALTYRAELRAERPDKLGRLFDATPKYYEQLTHAAIGAVPFPVEVVTRTAQVLYRARIPGRIRLSSRWIWWLRHLQGKLLSVLRLLKGLSTYQGGLEYVLWKIERHAQVKIEIPSRWRRYPLLGVCVVFWRLYRRGAFR